MTQDKSQISEPKYPSLVRGIGYSFKKGCVSLPIPENLIFQVFCLPCGLGVVLNSR